MVDRNCGKEVFFEGFDGANADYSAYGRVKEKAASAVEGAELKTNYLSLRGVSTHSNQFVIPKKLQIVCKELRHL